MKEAIDINLNSLVSTLADFRVRGEMEITTIQIIEKYMGGFHQNRGVDPSTSWNAQFGKYLKAHMTDLGIVESDSKLKVRINNSDTTSSLWIICANA